MSASCWSCTVCGKRLCPGTEGRHRDRHLRVLTGQQPQPCADDEHCLHWEDDLGPCCRCGDDTDAGMSDAAPGRPSGVTVSIDEALALADTKQARVSSSESGEGRG